MKRYVLVFALLFCFGLMAKAQQKAMYSQYMFNNLAINPAYSAVYEGLAISAISRHQWVGFAGAPNTQTISLNTPIKKSNTFIGAILIRDQIGEVLTETGGYFTLTQRVPIGDDSYLAAGINGGISSVQANYSNNYSQSPNSGNDPTFEDEKKFRSNLGFGVMIFSDKYYVGLSSPQFYSRDYLRDLSDLAITETTYRPSYMLQAGYLANINDDLKLKPNFLIKYINGSPVQYDLNANLLIKETLWLGASYRSAASVAALVSINITPDIQFGYSYDFAISELAKAQKGSHEIMLQFRFPIQGRDSRTYFF